MERRRLELIYGTTLVLHTDARWVYFCVRAVTVATNEHLAVGGGWQGKKNEVAKPRISEDRSCSSMQRQRSCFNTIWQRRIEEKVVCSWIFRHARERHGTVMMYNDNNFVSYLVSLYKAELNRWQVIGASFNSSMLSLCWHKEQYCFYWCN